ILKMDDGHRITEFHEKPPLDQLDGKDSPVSDEMAAEGRVYLASMGIYIFDADVLRDVLDAHPDDHDFGREIIPGAIHRYRVAAYPFTGYWNDIGTVRSFFETNIMLAQPRPAFNLYDPKMPLYTNSRMLPPAKVVRSTIEDSLIGEGSVIVDSDIADAVVGLRSFIGPGTHIRRSVLLGSDYSAWQDSAGREPVQGPARPGIGAGTRIENAIVDLNAAIGRDCALTNREGVEEGEGPGFYIRDGVV